ncbi:MAG: acyl-CoA thioesterase [Kiritimatiellae bacterium]|jgi:acyl-CoA hydrolase|nr:acyl-CoA thioesterase [Kiritimatiellia bacterium]
MITYKLVMPEHLNKFGDLFGGNMLKWVDEVAAMAVFIDFPGSRFLTIGMDQIEFKRPVKNGAVLKFVITPLKEGHTSVTYSVSVVEPNHYDNPYFTTSVTFVRVNKEMKKIPVRD